MPNGIRDQLCPPLPEESESSIRCKQIIDATINPSILRWANMLGLQEPNPRFRNDLVEALWICFLLALSQPKRPSLIRKELEKINKEAVACSRSAGRLISLLQTSNIYPLIRDHFLQLASQALQFADLSSMARAHPEMLNPDKGGPRGMIAFRALVEKLADAFESATGTPAWEAAKYLGVKRGHQGHFFDFVQAVLPIARELAPNMLLPDNRLAEDTYVFDVVSRLRRSRVGKRTKRKLSPKHAAHSKPTKTKRRKREHTA
jgi:hypothetical protein